MATKDRLATGNPSTRVVVGLGNAERQYQRTRHNLGARAVAEAISRLGLRAEAGLVPLPMTRSGFEYILEKHVTIAARKAPSIAGKGVSPHVLRHTCAMHTLQATRDVRKVSLWLGHASLQSTEVYLRADPSEKLEALATMVPPTLKPGRFRAPDKLLAMLSTAFTFWFLRDFSDVFWMIPVMGFCQLSLFGGYAIYFPELFPTRLRSTGTSFCYNVGRYITAFGVFLLGPLAQTLDGLTALPGFRLAAMLLASSYLIGLMALIWAPETVNQPLPEDEKSFAH